MRNKIYLEGGRVLTLVPTPPAKKEEPLVFYTDEELAAMSPRKRKKAFQEMNDSMRVGCCFIENPSELEHLLGDSNLIARLTRDAR